MKSFGNAWLIGGSYLISKISGKNLHRGMPLAVSLEPTNRCNLHCPECPSGNLTMTRPRGFMDETLFRSILDQLSPELRYLTLYFEGEPYLHPLLLRFVKAARNRNIFVSSSTNGHYFYEAIARETVESGLNKLIISVDGADQESYESYRRGGQLLQVLDGIRSLVQARTLLKKRTPRIVMQTLLLSSNVHHLNDIKALGKSLCVDKVVFKTTQFYNLNEKPSLMPDEQRFSRYANKAQNLYQVKTHRPDSCFRMWSSCVITWDGWVVPCCFDKDADYAFGNLREQPFREIWFGKKANEFRQQLLSDRTSIAICNNCTQTF